MFLRILIIMMVMMKWWSDSNDDPLGNSKNSNQHYQVATSYFFQEELLVCARGMRYFAMMHLRKKKCFICLNISLLIERKTLNKIGSAWHKFLHFPNCCSEHRSYLLWAYLGVRTSEIFLCLAPFVFLSCIVLTFFLYFTSLVTCTDSSYTEDEPLFMPFVTSSDDGCTLCVFVKSFVRV